MFRALICSSSGGNTDTTIGMFYAHYVSWLLAELELHSNSASSQLTQDAQNISIVVHTVKESDIVTCIKVN
jgi:hypothetical protein